MSLKCGLLGEKLGHSLSPEIHARLGDYEYRLYEKTPHEVEDFLLHGDYDVINITIPYKKIAFGLCDDATPMAKELGNVNVIVKRMDGTLFGDNTDAAGFVKLVEIVGVDVRGKKCVVLGTGGAAMTAAAALRGLGAGAVVHVSRTGVDNYGNLERNADAALVVNATPVGMFPNVDAQPVSLKAFPGCEAAIDLIYNPSPTKFLAEAAALGIPYVDGMPMLEEQARLASSYMNANIYLYGAPGSGKSTYAERLAAEKGMPLVDLDAEIVKSEGRSIRDIFAQDGEPAFRAKERAALERVSKAHGQIVALGGGALLDPECRRIAESTGRVVF
ncbi:MAG: shikimate kinase, partial [Kiritimatiellae bacterium]|nr:shikimate kinase [Kiritimatiellia bacterium]